MWRRVRQVLAGGVATAVVSLLWMTVVGFLPARSRPYVDGSSHDSLFEQVFLYNGLGRVGSASPLQMIFTGQGLALVPTGGTPGVGRLFSGDFGHDIGWLLPLALAAAVAGLIGARRRERTDPTRAVYLLWGGWLLVLAVAFSSTSTANSYYTAALAPAIAAITAVALVEVWRRDSARARVLAAAGVVGTALYAGFLISGPTPGAPRGLRLLLTVLTLVAVGLLLASAMRRHRRGWLRGGLSVGLLAALLVPTLGATEIVALGAGAFDTPFESRAEAIGIHKLFVAVPALIQRTLPGLERAQGNPPDLLATQSAAVASVFSYPTGQEVLPIGGFTGTGPTPTLGQLREEIATGRFHLVLTFPSPDPRVVWISRHCRPVGRSAPPLRDYYCTPPDAGHQP
jgi:hypothetical protein